MTSVSRFGLCLFLVFTLAACSNDDELTKEQVLKKSIADLESRFEARSLSQISEYVAEDYQDEQGRKLRDIKRIIQMQLMRHKSLHVFSTINSISWQDDNHATVEITAAMAGKPIKSASVLTSIRADMVKFTVQFVRHQDKFKVQSAKWRWAEATDFLQ
ncbi:MAG TPA: hypothetical protein ENJ44_08465 [Oceanospirillales bacterium]|nr:hypothetical protein [Oceanospirillales bacterium]